MAKKQTSTKANFRLFLQGELAKRRRKNSRYSLRAFASSLGIGHSALSQMMRGTRAISEKTILRLGPLLGLGPKQITSYLPSSSSAKEGQKKESTYNFSEDEFELLSDWYHHAIYELITLSDFRAEGRWIAKRLGISVSEANMAIERMVRVGIVEVGKDGQWSRKTSFLTTISNEYTSAAFKNFQSQVISKAETALRLLPMDIRDQSSMTMAINSKRLPEVKEKIKTFRRDLLAFLEEDADRDSVFQLGISFFPLTNIQDRRGDHDEN